VLGRLGVGNEVIPMELK